ncbi:uncharacterized protein LOC130895308 [Diorhabda carinulata]|uniref:uncharacterized protein LOC130895308 n=1 Tax=Diorhabda carinulata TaxID=1163345 RepID=UPI0025A07FF4|nr:uncharacterized protein LOC130895308 [Diorhabda carinulata]
MSSQDSGIVDIESDSSNYSSELDRILENYETAVKSENIYLLSTQYPISGYEVKCGISPARSFTPAVILSQHLKFSKISFSTYEWNTFISIMSQQIFLHTGDEFKPDSLPCGDYCTITPLNYDDSKVILVKKHGVEYYMDEEEVSQILELNNLIIQRRENLLVGCRTELDSWNLLKDALEQCFGDKRSLECLEQDLLMAHPFKNETTLDFAKRLQVLRSHLVQRTNSFSLAEMPANTKEIYRRQYDQMALKTLIRNLTGLLQHTIRLKNPMFRQQTPQTNFTYRNPNPTQSPNDQNPTNNFPRQPIPVQPRQITRHYPTNRQVFGQQKNVFAPTGKTPENKPEPMSINSRNTFRPNQPNHYFRPSNPRNFVSQELHQIQSDSHDSNTDYPDFQINHDSENPAYESDPDYSDSVIYFKICVDSHEIAAVRIPVSCFNGEVIIPSQNIDNLYFPETITIAKNGFAKTEIINRSDKRVEIIIKDRLKVIPLTNTIKQNYNFYYTEDILQNRYSKNHEENIQNFIRTEHLNEEEKEAILKLYNDFKDIFHKDKDNLTFTNEIKHEIKTLDEVPVHTKSYRYPYIHKEEVQRQIKKMLDDGIIRPSSSPWSSPVWIVPKKTDASNKQKWRIVIDYRKVNEKTLEDRYPVPRIGDVLDRLGRCQYFSTIDLASGFHQIQMHENSISKTAFSVENGHYEYLRMPFGLRNARATFQRVMDNVLKDLQGKICMVYMDDIIIFSSSLEEHIANLKLLFEDSEKLTLKFN